MTEEREQQPAEPAEGTEAGKWRTQLREREAELATATTALAAARDAVLRAALADYRLEIEDVDGEGRSRTKRVTFNVDALGDAALDHERVFGEDGRVNHETLDEMMRELHGAKPYMFGSGGQRMVLPGLGGRPALGEPQPGFESAFGPKGASDT